MYNGLWIIAAWIRWFSLAALLLLGWVLVSGGMESSLSGAASACAAFQLRLKGAAGRNSQISLHRPFLLQKGWFFWGIYLPFDWMCYVGDLSVTSNSFKGSSGFILGTISSPIEQWCSGSAAQGGGDLHPWKCCRAVGMWLVGTVGGLGSDLGSEGSFQPKWFSVILYLFWRCPPHQHIQHSLLWHFRPRLLPVRMSVFASFMIAVSLLF